MVSLTLPDEFGYVVLSIGASYLVNMFLVIQVVKARKAYGVEYPTLYAPAEHKYAMEFNCVQRAHQNTLELLAPMQVAMLVNGLAYPIYSAAFGAVYVLGRLIYGIGYKKGPKGRMLGGIISHLGDLPLIFLTFFTAAKFIRG